MVLHGGMELTGDLLSILQTVLVDPSLFDGAKTNRMLGDNLERMIAHLARRNLIILRFAKALIKQLLSICTPARAELFYELRDYIHDSLKALIDQYPREVGQVLPSSS